MLVPLSPSITVMSLSGLVVGWRIKEGFVEAVGGFLLLLLFALRLRKDLKVAPALDELSLRQHLSAEDALQLRVGLARPEQSDLDLFQACAALALESDNPANLRARYAATRKLDGEAGRTNVGPHLADLLVDCVVVFVFHAVVFGWILFRSRNLDLAGTFISRLADPGSRAYWTGTADVQGVGSGFPRRAPRP